MRNLFLMLTFAVMLTAIAGFGGCGGQQAAESGGGAAADDHAHEHAHEGPHGGHIIELGDEKYHAELTHDDATHTIAVFILDGTAAANAPVAAESVMVNVLANEIPQQFTLAAKALPDDPAGKTSHFELVDEKLCDGLDGGWDPHTSKARLNITIDDTPYYGDIELHEEGDEHEHAEGHDHE